ncbi:UNVERIFIED_CONTAM: hypothetical protein Slati_4380500 [Sesamum latifolium]|uniref:3'-5' exonuclease domain-containing protein n=1 Tax=Sesamum latifolium TaxID=2727402 RepID=A0AAW2SQR5_9LAMI
MTCDKTLENEACLSTVPIHVVTDASQLPAEFLQPSCERQLVIGFDCEGVDLCRDGLHFQMQSIWLMLLRGGETTRERPVNLHLSLKLHQNKVHSFELQTRIVSAFWFLGVNILADDYVLLPARQLSFRGRIWVWGRSGVPIGFSSFLCASKSLIAYSLIKEQKGHKRVPDDYISFVGLLADPRFGGISYVEKEESPSLEAGQFFLCHLEVVAVYFIQDPNFWTYRPLSELMVRAAADDVRFLLFIYHKMVEKLNERSLWYLAVRGALYCRCFCTDDTNFADWPPLPPIPDNLIADKTAPEEEILSVLDVPRGKNGMCYWKTRS